MPADTASGRSARPSSSSSPVGLELYQTQLNESPGWVTQLTHLASAYWWVGTFAFRASAQAGVLFSIAALLGIALVASVLRKGTWWLAVIFPLALRRPGLRYSGLCSSCCGLSCSSSPAS